MPDSPPVKITTRSGTVRVVATDGAALAVVGGVIEHLDDGTVHIRRERSADAIEVTCATGTDITIGTVSGKVELVGRLGAVRVATVSGTIRTAETAGIDVRTKSGKVDIGVCAGDCRVMTKSASVHIRRADRATVAAVSGVVLMEQVRGAEVKTISGKVLLSLAPNGERVSVHTVSGKVEVRVPAATLPSTRLRTVSGKIRCDCPTGDDLEIAVASVSGAIRVSSD